MKQGIDMLVMA